MNVTKLTKFLLAFAAVGFISSAAFALPSAGINYSSYGGAPSIASWAIRNGDPESTTLEKASLTAPANGFIVVSATGNGCIYKNGKYIEVWLSDNSDNSEFHYLGSDSLFSIANNSGSNQPCGVGQFQSFSFQYLRSVRGNTKYTFYLKGHQGDSETTGLFDVSRILITYYPTRY